jgi:hypothetical protein
VHPSCQTLGVDQYMASRRSATTAKVATEAENCLRSGQLQLRAWFRPAETLKRLCFLSTSCANLQRPYHCHPNDYVSARAEARSNSNVGQGHAGSVAFYRLRSVAAPWRASAGYHASTVALSPATPNPSIEGMPKRLRLLCTPHVKR